MLFFGTKTHHILDAGAVVPTAVEDDDFAGCGKMRDVALEVDLRFFAIGRCRQRNHAEYAWTDPAGDRLDGAALAGRVTPLEHDDNPQALLLDPILEPAEVNLQLAQIAFVGFAREFRTTAVSVGLPCSHDYLPSFNVVGLKPLRSTFRYRPQARRRCAAENRLI